MINDNEVWRVVYWPDMGYIEDLRVSNYGRVKKRQKRSMDRATWKIATQWPDRDGYMRIEYKDRDYRVNRLVAFAFIENDDPENKTQVDHINADKKNNYCGDAEHNFTNGNLRWVTPQGNTVAAVEMGLRRPAEYMNVIAINKDTLHAHMFRSQKECAEYIKTDPKAVSSVVNNPRKTINGWRIFKLEEFNDDRFQVEYEERQIKAGSSNIGGSWVNLKTHDGYDITIVDDSPKPKTKNQLVTLAKDIFSKLTT